jgi:hypothetical protein
MRCTIETETGRPKARNTRVFKSAGGFIEASIILQYIQSQFDPIVRVHVYLQCTITSPPPERPHALHQRLQPFLFDINFRGEPPRSSGIEHHRLSAIPQ